VSCCDDSQPTYDFDLYQDTTFDSVVFAYVNAETGAPEPLNGLTSKMTIEDSAGNIMLTLISTDITGSRMIQDDDAGTTQPYIEYGDLLAADFPVGKYKYDVIFYDNDIVIRPIVKSVIQVNEAVTVK
jgi:hypothetical protein